MTVLRLLLATTVLSFGLGVLTGWLCFRPSPAMHPLEVTGLDSGGADLKIETCIVEGTKK